MRWRPVQDVAAWRQAIRDRPALLLFLANAVAQGLGLLAAPWLTRLYTPSDFGVLGALSAFVMIGAPIMSGRYDMAMTRIRQDREAFQLLTLCLWVIVVMTLALGVLSWALLRFSPLPQRVAWSWHLQWVEWWWLLPLALACVALYDTLGLEASRRQAFMPLARSKLVQAGAGQGSQIAFGLLGLGTGGLLLGFLINQAAGVARLVQVLWWRHPGRHVVCAADLLRLAWRERRFPLYASWSASLEASARWLPQLALSLAWDPTLGGYVFLAERVVGRPLLMLSTSFLPVFVARFSAALHGDAEALCALYRAVLWRQAALTLAWTAAVLLIAPLAVGPLFGAAWDAAVPYVQLSSLVIAPLAAMHAVSHTLELAGWHRTQSAIVVCRVALTVVLLVACHARGLNALAALTGLAVLNAVLTVATVAVHLHVIARLAHPFAAAKGL